MLFHSDGLNKCIFLCTILCVAGIDCLSQNNTYDPHSDTITIVNVIGKFKPPLHVDFEFDTICIELYLDDTRLAILPANLKQYIDSTRVYRTEQESETLSDGRNVLRIKMFITKMKKGRP